MNADFPFLSRYRSRTGLISFSVVLITAIWLGYWGAGLLTNPPIPTYQVDFGKAKWISPPEQKSIGYFRKNIYVAGVIKHAWIGVAATDSFQLFINNKQVMLNQNPLTNLRTMAVLPSSCPSALVDIRPYLQMGTNAIAVYVLRATYTSPVRMKLRGQIVFEGGGSQEYQTDPSWRASTYPGVLRNLVPWTDPNVDDQHWPFAVMAREQGNSGVQPVLVPPWVLESPVKAYWLGSFPDTAKSISFSRDYYRPLGSHEDWLQIASIGENMVMINGRTVIDSTPATNIQAETSGALSPTPSLHFYWVAPWLHVGNNHIEVRVESTEPESPPQMICQVTWLSLGGTPEVQASDHSWKVASITGQGTVDKGREALQLSAVNYSGSAWGVPPYLSYPDIYSATEMTHRLLCAITVGLLLGLMVFFLHLIAADYFVRRGADSDTAFTVDALLHLPVLLFLLLFTLLPYDVRLSPGLATHPVWLFALLFLWIGMRWLVGQQRFETRAGWEEPAWRRWAGGRGFIILLGSITVVAFIIRVAGINLFPVDQDEVFICNCAHGVWARGYPSIEVHNYVYRLSTYEILPYPIAVTGLLFGWTDWSVRIPALLFGTFTTLLLGRLGRELFSWRVGLLAAIIYTLNPWDVYWARHCFHPAQAQFLALLCFGAFYRAVKVPGVIDGREFYKCCTYYILLYLTWEGTGLVFPILGLALVFMQGWNFNWLKQWPLYCGTLFVMAVVVSELMLRATSAPSYPFIGYGLANLTPALVFLDPSSDTTFYIAGIIQEQCHLLLAVAILFGVFFIGGNRPLRYVLLLFGFILFGFSNLLPVYSTRYFYFYQTLLILGGVAVLDEITQRLALAWREFPRHLVSFSRVAWAAIVGLVVLTTTTRGLHLYRLHDGMLSSNSIRYGLNWQDARDPCEYIASHLQPGDIIAGGLSQSFTYFTHKRMDYTPNPMLSYRSVYDSSANGTYGTYENPYTGNAILRNDRDSIEMLGQGKRIWFLGHLPPVVGDKISTPLAVLARYSRIVYTNPTVTVYLCEGVTSQPDQLVPDPSLPANGLLIPQQQDDTTPGYVTDSFGALN